MNQTKIFIVFTFLLAFALQASAQEQTPKIVWENLQESYQSFAEIKPVIKNSFDKSIYLYPTLDIRVMVFDSNLEVWDLSKYSVIICRFGEKPPKRKSVKIDSNKTIFISDWIYWNYQLLGDNGAFQDYNKPDWKYMSDYKTGRKYKLIITFSDKKFKNFTESESPEFWVKPNIYQ